MTSLDTATTVLTAQDGPGRSVDEEQKAAASFCRATTVEHSRRTGTICG